MSKVMRSTVATTGSAVPFHARQRSSRARVEDGVRAVAVAEQAGGCEIGKGRGVCPGQDVPPPRAGSVGLLALGVKDKAFAQWLDSRHPRPPPGRVRGDQGGQRIQEFMDGDVLAPAVGHQL
ncbi:hypothetical protein CG719_05760 [Streptomyces sp. CB01373]|nr:hypothetical protein CG719_05760 [Streptomyces sp. CB01373]